MTGYNDWNESYLFGTKKYVITQVPNYTGNPCPHPAGYEVYCSSGEPIREGQNDIGFGF
jgi:hypothetical protein